MQLSFFLNSHENDPRNKLLSHALKTCQEASHHRVEKMFGNIKTLTSEQDTNHKIALETCVKPAVQDVPDDWTRKAHKPFYGNEFQVCAFQVARFNVVVINARIHSRRRLLNIINLNRSRDPSRSRRSVKSRTSSPASLALTRPPFTPVNNELFSHSLSHSLHPYPVPPSLFNKLRLHSPQCGGGGCLADLSGCRTAPVVECGAPSTLAPLCFSWGPTS